MEQTANNLVGKKVKVVENIANPGIACRSYTHGETGLVIQILGEMLLVKLDNAKKYGKPYRYSSAELRLLK